jgi:hypothetical protein
MLLVLVSVARRRERPLLGTITSKLERRQPTRVPRMVAFASKVTGVVEKAGMDKLPRFP